MEHCFFKLRRPYSRYDELKRFVSSTDGWDTTDGFFIYRLDSSWLTPDPTLSALSKKLDARAEVFRMAPSAVYNWHLDRIRGCAINTLLNCFGSISMMNVGMVSEFNHRTALSIAVVPYQDDGAMFALNTRVMHAVVNPTTEWRDVLSIGFPPDVSYHQLKTVCADLGI